MAKKKVKIDKPIKQDVSNPGSGTVQPPSGPPPRV